MQENKSDQQINEFEVKKWRNLKLKKQIEELRKQNNSAKTWIVRHKSWTNILWALTKKDAKSFQKVKKKKNSFYHEKKTAGMRNWMILFSKRKSKLKWQPGREEPHKMTICKSVVNFFYGFFFNLCHFS